MTELIATLRGLTNAGTADYTIGTVNFWSDDELQRVLDRHRRDFFHEDVVPAEEYSGQLQSIRPTTARARTLKPRTAGPLYST
jgi:hypothetical protein